MEKSWKWINAYEKARTEKKSVAESKKLANKTIKKRVSKTAKVKAGFDFDFGF